MSERNRTKKQILEELEYLRRRVAELESSGGKQSFSDQVSRLLFDNLSDAIFVHQGPGSNGIPGKFLDVNDTACRRLGYTREELLQKSTSDIDAPDAIPHIPAIMKKLLAQKYVVWEGAHLTKDGRRIPVEITTHLFEGNGIPTILSTARDITSRKRVEEERQQALALLEASISQSPSGILVADAPNVTIRLANSAALGIRGKSDQPLTGIAVEQHSTNWLTFRPDGQPYASEDLPLSRAILKGETILGEEAIIRNQDGDDHWVSVNAAPIRDRDGKITAGIVIFHDITERKRTEKDLHESEERYRTLVDTIPDGFYRSTPDGRFVDVNPAMVTMLGYDSKEELLRIDIPAELYFRPEERIPGVINNEDFIGETEVYQLRKKDGTGIWLEDRCHYLRDESGKIQYHEGICRDISDRKRAEEAVRKSEEKYRGIFENVQDVFFEALIDGTLLDVSPSIGNMSKGQYRRDELLGRSVFDFVTEERQNLQSKLLEQGSVTDYEVTLKNRDGSLIPCSLSSKIQFDAQGRPEKIIGSVRDIAERKRAEMALQETENRLTTIFKNDPTGIFIVNEKTRIIYDINDSALEVLGLPREDVVGKTCHRFLCPAEMACCPICDLGQVVDRSERVLLKPDGTRVPILKTVVPIQLKGENYLLESFIDITERKRAEMALQETEARLSTIFKNDPTGIFIVNEKTRIIYDINDSALGLIGLPREDVVGKVCHRFLCPAETGRCPICDLGQVVDRSERVLLKPNGTRVPILKTVVPIQLKGENYLLESFIDITERKHAEEIIHKSEQQFRLVWDNSADGMRLTDEEGRVLIVNEALCRMVGKERSELEGESFSLIFEKEQQEHVVRRYKERFTSRTIETHLGREITLWNGRKIWIEVTNSFLEFEGQPPLLLGIFRDITERKQAEAERERLIRELQEALSDIKTLSGLVPICSNCKKIRDDKGYWNQLEAFIQERSKARFSHGICPDCLAVLYPEYVRKKKE